MNYAEYDNITMPYEDAIEQYPRLAILHKDAVRELETNYKLPAFKHTTNLQITLIFDDSSNGEPVGFCIWFYDARDRMVFIGLIYVVPKYRTIGNGTRLLELVTNIAENAYSAKYVAAYIVAANEPSVKMHQRFFGMMPNTLGFIKQLTAH